MKLQLILLDDLFYRGTGPQGLQGLQGIQGPTGPTGPTAIETYGRKYNTSTDNISLETNIAQNIPLW